MIEKGFFGKHRSRLILEGLLKASVSGLLIGAAVNFVAALLAWGFDFGGILFAVGAGLLAALVSGALMYFVKYRPTTVEIARRVDRLGLEERLITMVELQGDDSYIAQRQREDTQARLSEVSEARLHLRVSALMTVLTVVALLVGGTMTTLAGLAENNVIPSGSDLFNPEDPMENLIAVTYAVEEGGEIQGVTEQLLLYGESTTPVVAVPEDGWMFVGWDDGGENPSRHETNVTQELYFVAIFEEIMDNGGESEDKNSNDKNGGGGEEGDKAEDLPQGNEANADNGEKGPGDKGSGSGDEGNSDGAQGEGEEQGEGKGDGQGLGAGGKWEDSNQFIDGETYYGDYLDMYYEMAKEIFESNGEIPPELREFFETYFDSI